MNLQSAHSVRTDEWVEIQTPHFTLDSDLSELAARQVARNLEEMRASLIEAAWTGAREPPRGRIDVVVFRTPGEFERYSGQSAQAVGVAISRPGARRLLSFSPGSENTIPSVVTHEMVHDLSQWFLPIQPTWFAEGLATYLETTRYDAAAHTAVMGDASESHLKSLARNGGFTSAVKLFAAQGSIDLDPRVSFSFYSSSWLFLCYLMNADGARFAQFQTRLAHLQDWQRAWDETFPGVTPEVLDQRVMAYLKEGGKFTRFTTPVPLELSEPNVRSLSPAEQHGVLAWVASAGDSELADREASEALRLDRNELRALVVRSGTLGDGAAAERLELAKRAIGAHPQSSDAWLLWARAQPSGEARRTALEKALQLEPEHPGVLTLLADELVRQGRAADALAHTRLALRRSPATFELLQLHLDALIANHECRDAEWVEGNAERRFQDNCTASVNGAVINCGQFLRDRWDARNQACSRSRGASAAAAPKPAK
jgi:tetratricopeptide (TPR) repeat protein